MDLLNTLKDLRRIISEDFYKRLLEGKISDAKNTGNYIISLISDIIKDLDKIIEAAELNTNSLSDAKKELQKKTIEFKNLIESELKNIDEKIFREDQAVWEELLEDEFGNIINQLLLAINKIYSIMSNLDHESKEDKPISTKRYLKLKFNKKVYADNLTTIEEAERKICKRVALLDFSNPKITGKIKSGKWKGFLHAHLPMPLGDHRIIYTINNKNKVVLLDIGTHKELGIS